MKLLPLLLLLVLPGVSALHYDIYSDYNDQADLDRYAAIYGYNRYSDDYYNRYYDDGDYYYVNRNYVDYDDDINYPYDDDDDSYYLNDDEINYRLSRGDRLDDYEYRIDHYRYDPYTNSYTLDPIRERSTSNHRVYEEEWNTQYTRRWIYDDTCEGWC